MKLYSSVILLFSVLLTACSSEPSTNKKDIAEERLFPVSAVITELTDKDYPDNPDISIRSFLDGQYSHRNVIIAEDEQEGRYSFIFTPNNKKSDTLVVSGIDLLEYIPACPSYIEDEYTRYIGIVNQEWNRQQVKYFDDQFAVTGVGDEKKIVKRIDIARNCLNAYLWEIIAYTEEEGKLKPYYHGWFDFPKKQYAKLFEERNDADWSKYEKALVNWVDPENKEIDLKQFRKVINHKEIDFENKNNEYYPVKGERKKKEVNIIVPKAHTSINDFLTDSTLFGTFSPPGFYNTADPRKTELGRLNNPTKIEVANTKHGSEHEYLEVKIFFNDTINDRKTSFVIGGLKKSDIPTLSLDNIHQGFQMPMGISNHSFYETHQKMTSTPSNENPYYAFLFDGNNNWIDSHKIGIDGPLLHFEEGSNKLHIWVLSFERHAFVGHYVIEL